MRTNTTPFARRWALSVAASLVTALPAALAFAQTTPAESLAAMGRIGRTATPAEVQAWDIDVRADFKGLPKGKGSVSQGETIWEGKCASCHGVFGESNEVFTPIVGGTAKEDVQTGRVAHLAERGYPQRTTLMKVSKLSTLWDYINRAMPWTAPKSLAPDEVYAVLAYILNLGNIVPADFTLSDQNMAQVQERLPNRNGKVWHKPLWEVAGKGDVVNPLCMKNCPVEDKVASALPVDARNTHGNIAEQVRPFGEVRGTDTTAPPREALAASQPATTVAAATAAAPIAATPSTAAGATAKPAAAAPNGAALVKANGCTACHGMSNKIVGPSFKDITAKYAGTPDAASYLSGKIRSGGQGVWGPVPMPEQAQIKDADLRAMGQWLAEGGK